MGKKKRTGRKGTKVKVTRHSLKKLMRARLDKIEAERKEGKASCILFPRTVEMHKSPPTHKESGKLLFALALGLTPNSINSEQPDPAIHLERLAPSVVAEARERTSKAIFDICRKKKNMCPVPESMDCPVNPLPPSNDIVTIIDLVSSEDEADNEMEEAPVQTRSTGNGDIPQDQNTQKSPRDPTSKRKAKPLPSRQSARPVLQPWKNQSNRIFEEWNPTTIERRLRSTTSRISQTRAACDPSSQNKNGFTSELLSFTNERRSKVSIMTNHCTVGCVPGCACPTFGDLSGVSAGQTSSGSRDVGD